jgi:hypothetical protein
MSGVRPAETAARNSASFRDPSGYVFQHHERIFRAINAECFATLEPLLKENWLTNTPVPNAVVPTRLVAADDPVHASLSSVIPGSPVSSSMSG